MNKESGGAQRRELVPQGEMLPVPLTRPRHRCPFYGFALAPATGGVLLDQQGDQCPLIVGRCSPCAMEMEGDTPDWDRCRFFNTETHRPLVEVMFGRCTIFPRELPAEGTSLRLWAGYVMNDHAVTRPPKKDVPNKK